MSHRKLLAAVALLAAVGAGATLGLFLGIPGLSGAQTPTPSPTSNASPRPGMGPRWAFGKFGFGGGAASLDIVAKDLTMTPADLKSALRAGQSIAAIASSKNVDVQKIINDLVADATSRIDAAVSSGKITAAMAATIKSNLTAGITAFVNGTPGPGLPFGPGSGFGDPFGGPFKGPFGGPFGKVPGGWG